MTAFRVPGLSKLITGLKAVCKVIAVSGPVIRQFVPSESQAAYDAALSSIMSACDVIRAIDYLDSSSGTNAPWGA